jgi:GNAT superfamily N-acetyltransferase
MRAHVSGTERPSAASRFDAKMRWVKGQLPSGSLIPRTATVVDAVTMARLLNDFNVEFGDPSPGQDVLARRLRRLLSADSTLGLLAGDPAAGFALLTLRTNVWYDTAVALLDELYVVPSMRGRGIGSALLESACRLVRGRGVELMEINVDGEDRDARRFYQRHGFSCVHGSQLEPELYYSREFP